MKIIGIDLAGKENNPSGFSILLGKILRAKHVYTNDEIISNCLREHPELIAIDAPLTMPLKGNLRSPDLELIKRGLRVLPPTLGGMRQLTERAIRLAAELCKKRFQIIEIHPRTSGVILFKTSDRRKWVEKLREKGFEVKEIKSEHEIDATMAAITAWLHLQGKTEAVGEGKDVIVIPLPKSL
jgi:hypothetical protein